LGTNWLRAPLAMRTPSAVHCGHRPRELLRIDVGVVTPPGGRRATPMMAPLAPSAMTDGELIVVADAHGTPPEVHCGNARRFSRCA